MKCVVMNEMAKRILAVDDNPSILEVLNEILLFEGYEVITLADGHDIFKIISETHPDLILLDIMLGGMDGREICQEIKENESTHNIPVILISATHNIESFISQSGCPDDFVAKPFDIYYLLGKIEKQLAA